MINKDTYKRLTNNNLEEYDPEYDFCIGCKYFGDYGCNRPNGTCSNYERFMETYNRLDELEDKIENGTLFEIPCKVGDKFWWVNEYCPTPRIEEYEVSTITIAKDNKIYLVGECKCITFKVDEVYFTKAEAEARLKELKGE